MSILPLRRSHRAVRRHARVSVGRTVGLLAAFFLAPALAAAQQTTAGLRVTVTASETGEPVAGAVVRVGGTDGKLGRSDAEGRVLIGGIPAGRHLVTIEAPGYGNERAFLSFEPLRVVDVAFALGPEPARGDGSAAVERDRTLFDLAPIPIDPIEVTVERRNPRLAMVGFYDRAKAAALGTFLDAEEIEERTKGSPFLSNALWGVPGIRIVPNLYTSGPTMYGGSGYRVESTRGRASIARSCSPRVWLDGAPMNARASADINSLVTADAVIAIEVYAGAAEAPAEFNVTGGGCGAIVIWTGARVR